MQISTTEVATALIEVFEGCRLQSYRDSGGLWTIGIGHTRGVSEGQTITRAQAEAFFREDRAAFLAGRAVFGFSHHSFPSPGCSPTNDGRTFRHGSREPLNQGNEPWRNSMSTGKCTDDQKTQPYGRQPVELPGLSATSKSVVGVHTPMIFRPRRP